MPQIGERVRMSELEEGDAAEWRGRKFVVSAAFPPEDGAPGMTELYYENSEYELLYWNHRNPRVTYIGTGRVHILVKFNDC